MNTNTPELIAALEAAQTYLCSLFEQWDGSVTITERPFALNNQITEALANAQTSTDVEAMHRRSDLLMHSADGIGKVVAASHPICLIH